MAIWSRLFGGVFGVGVGIAAADAIEPVLEVAKQDAWQANAFKVLDAATLAQLVAEGKMTPGDAQSEGTRTGYNATRVNSMIQLALKAPGVAETLRMYRLSQIPSWPDKIGADDVKHALRKAGIESRWHAPILAQLTLPLEPADLANAVQQGFVPNAGLLPADPGGTHGITPPVVEVPLDTLGEFEAGGVNEAHARVLAELVGLPPGPMELADLLNRGVITDTAYDDGVREGHTKTKWTSALKQLRWYLLSPTEAAELRLKGWLTKAESDALGLLRGADSTVMEHLFLARGRPATVKETYRAYARGAFLPGFEGNVDGAMDRAVVESDLRPEWEGILKADAPNYPSLFQLNRLVSSGAITGTVAADWARKAGYAPEVVTALEAEWAKPAGSAASSWPKRAATQLWSSTHRGFMRGDVDEAAATSALEVIGLTPAEVTSVLDLWTVERSQISRDITQAQAIKLFRKAIWTRVQAEDYLIGLGMTTDNANALLDAA